MSLIHKENIVSHLKNRYIFVDTSALIDADRNSEFLDFFEVLEKAKSTLFTVPSVIFEYARSSNHVSGYTKRLAFAEALHIHVLNRVEELLDKDCQLFLTLYNSCFKDGKSPSYTDALLCAMAYKHRNSKPLIFSANHKDIPLELFDREEIVVIDSSSSKFQIEAFYSFSETKFNNILQQKLKD